ncbi:MAG TPA: hypothetical protein VHU79_11165 [Sphingomicrobium sp.]|nr:hypothetical protein [Sphingomicrobium sp.]
MRKFMTLTSAAAMAFAGGYAALPAPALAQAQPNIAEIIVYGNDPCPRSTNNEIYVCNRRPEAERYRIPPNMRQSGTPQQMQSWAVRSKSLETTGETGLNSCSAVGPAGYTGCLERLIQESRGERKQQADEATPPQQ